MSARRTWFQFNIKYREDDWLLALPPEQQLAWWYFLSWMNEYSWLREKVSMEALARVTCFPNPVAFAEMLKVTLVNGHVIDEDGCWFVPAGIKYNDWKKTRDDNADRQRRFRERHGKKAHPTHEKRSDTPQDTGQDTGQDTRRVADGVAGEVTGEDKDNFSEAYQAVIDGFDELSERFPNIKPLRGKLSAKRKEHIRAKWKEDGWDWPGILDAVGKSAFLRGECDPIPPRKDRFAFNFEFCFVRQDRWREILEGKYGEDYGNQYDQLVTKL